MVIEVSQQSLVFSPNFPVMANLRRHFSPTHYEGIPSGPLSFLNPTHRRFAVPERTPQETPDHTEQDASRSSSKAKAANSLVDGQTAAAVDWKWRSRDNRKGERGNNIIV